MQRIGNDWDVRLAAEFQQEYFVRLECFLEQEYESNTVFPERERLYAALKITSYEDTRVVILGQDPYHGRGQAHGLSFSVQEGRAIPPSLRNIYKELADDIAHYIPKHGNLEHWAKQGVLLLNTVLTVREGQPNSHKGLGWERLTDRIISLLNHRETPVVFILWGAHAAQKLPLIDERRHAIIASAHPSPLSARKGFFGSRPFSQANAHLKRFGLREIDWRIR
jgi:uracil-DNA glycosylase